MLPGASGSSRTFGGITSARAEGIIPKAIWEALPHLSSEEQLPYVEAAIFTPAKKLLGRPFANAFEVYLGTLAPGLLRSDGNYSPETPLYTGKSYPDHWTMDNFPAGIPAYRAWASGRGGRLSLAIRDAYPEAGKLVQKGLLKGYVSLGDLRAFAKRQDPARDEVLGSVLSQIGAHDYAPDLDSLFQRGVAADLRAPTPEEARWAAPQRGITFDIDAKWVFALGASVAILAAGLSIYRRTVK